MHLAKCGDKHPYYKIFNIYLACCSEEQICLLKNMISNIYPEIIDNVIPVLSKNDITDPYVTFQVVIQDGDAFYRQQKHIDCYAWSNTPITINVPYGNIIELRNPSYNWLSLTSRTLRGIMHASRLLSNPTPDIRQHANVFIPWIPTDKKESRCTLDELKDYYEIVLSILSSNTWVRSKSFIMQHC